MRGDKSEKICKYHNTGFCKYKENCKYFHAKLVCDGRPCFLKTCRNRHPKLCKYKESCKRKTSCFYDHSQKVIEQDESLKNEIAKLKGNFADVTKQLINLRKEFETLKVKVESREKESSKLEEHIQTKDFENVNEIYESEDKEFTESGNVCSLKCKLCKKTFKNKIEAQDHYERVDLYCEDCKECICSESHNGDLVPDDEKHMKHNYREIFKCWNNVNCFYCCKTKLTLEKHTQNNHN